MKKIILAFALLAAMVSANAQTKSPAAISAAVESAKAAAANEKKATKVATWLKLAQTYMEAYNSPAGNGILGQPKDQVTLLQGKPASSAQVEINGDAWTKDSYATADYYYDGSNTLQVIDVTKPVVANALEEALKAYNKAAEVDNGSKANDIANGIKDIAQKYVEEGYKLYTFGDPKAASYLFEKAADATLTKGAGELDTQSLYNAGFTAWVGADYTRAKACFEKCLANNFEAKDGEVYAKIADCCSKLGDKEGQKTSLETGFSKFPQSQGILIGLINYYIDEGTDTNRLFELVDEAKKNEPTNASLYYVEGNIHNQLGNVEKAVEAYEKAATVNPEYEYGFIGEGLMFYNRAVDIQEKAQEELDDTKYAALVADFEKSLKSCIAPFEKAFEITKAEEVKQNIAEYLKNAFYRFRDEDASYMKGYEKYNGFLKN